MSLDHDNKPALSSTETMEFLMDLEQVRSHWRDSAEITNLFRHDEGDHIRKIQEVIGKLGSNKSPMSA